MSANKKKNKMPVKDRIKSLDKREVLRKILLLVCVIVFAVSAYQIISKYYNDYATNKLYQGRNTAKPTLDIGSLDQSAEKNEDFKVADNADLDKISSSYKVNYEYVEGMGLDLNGDAMSSIVKAEQERFNNEDVVGYIKVADTNVDYPILQSYTSNDYYLKKDAKKRDSGAASIYLDYRNRLYTNDKNMIIYGHNMRNGSMFGTLRSKYRDKNFALSHREFTIETRNERETWQIFSVYETNISFYYIETIFKDDKEFATFIDECTKRSYYNFENKPTVKDRILTLSTCASEKDDRFVVQAKLVKTEQL